MAFLPPSITAEQHEILRTAIVIARNEHVTKRAKLRAILQERGVGSDADIQAALLFWAEQEVRTSS